MSRSILVLLAVLGASAIGRADIIVNEPFPASGDSYCSDGGCGTIPLGGQTGSPSIAGDYVQSPVFTGTGITSLTDLNLTLTADDDLQSGQQENWEIYVNGVDTGWYAYVN
jgi:hypothetical protein